MTRVCHITTVHPVDDHRILHKECVSLTQAGYDVTLIAPHERDEVVHGVRVVALRIPARNRLERVVRRPRGAYRAALALDADLYHFHDPEFLPYGVRLARAGKRVVYDAHEDIATQVRHKEWIPAPGRRGAAGAGARFEAACAARMDAVVSPSLPALERLRRRQPRAVLVANYPRVDEIVPAARWEQRRPAACYVGAVTGQRGARELVAAMADVDAELYLAGAIDPPALRNELKGAPGWRHVRYLGRIDHERATALLSEVRVGVIPLHPIANYRAAYPVKLFEYMAAGLPIVATDVPRWREVLETHDCGVCVPHGSPRRLAAAIAELLDDDARARAMGERARRAAEERYSWQSQSDALLALYGELLS
ncbi:MAG: glycosyltransferase family 4 protein [Solirubrobacteraceae bacterium]